MRHLIVYMYPRSIQLIEVIRKYSRNRIDLTHSETTQKKEYTKIVRSLRIKM